MKKDFIFHEGDHGDHFYLVEEGEVELGHEDEQGEMKPIRVLSTGAHFGEIALIKGVKRTLSVRVTSERAKLLLLTRDAFTRILRSIKGFLKMDWSLSSFDAPTLKLSKSKNRNVAI